MLEVLIGVGLGVLGVANVALWFKLSACHDALTQLITRSHDLTIDIPAPEDFRDEITDTLQDFMSNLHVPNAGDHLISAAANGLNMFFHNKFGKNLAMLQEHVIQQAEPPIERDVYTANEV